jgi:TRAP-type C4-dicarboxylate transport system substrate-binding protein
MKRFARLSGAARLGGAIAVTLALGSAPATAQDKKPMLRVADSFPVTHYMVPHAKFWMDEVKRLSGDAVEFEYYPSEQMGKAKDLLNLTLSGVIDVGYVAPSYVSDKLPLSGVVNLPGGFSRSCPGTLAYWDLAKEGGLLAQKELAPAQVRLIFAVALQPYQVFSVKRPLDSAKAFDGMKLRSTGGAMDQAVRKVKAVPVQMASPEVHQSLSRGTLDGGVFPFTTVVAYDWGSMLKYATVGENFGSFLVTYMISETKWKQLPPNVQKAMLAAGEATTKRACAQLENDEEGDKDKLRKAGVAIGELPASAHAELSAAMGTVSEEWAQTLDKRGRPGSEVLKAYREAVARHK